MMNEGCDETGGKVEIAGRSLIGVRRREWKIEKREMESPFSFTAKDLRPVCQAARNDDDGGD